MEDLGELHYFLCLEFWRDNGRTFVTQRKYTHELIKRFNMNGCKVVSTPLKRNVKLNNDDKSK